MTDKYTEGRVAQRRVQLCLQIVECDCRSGGQEAFQLGMQIRVQPARRCSVVL